jgi:diaminopimelate epimerase
MVTMNPSTFEADYDVLRRKVVHGFDLDRLSFSIMHGNGNVLAIVDEELSGLSRHHVDGVLAREVCQSFQVPRVDGVAFLSTSGDRVAMTYFERDGTHSQMCGNALRCSTRYCAERGYISTEDFISTDDGEKWVSMSEDRVRVALGSGREFREVDEDRYFVFSGLPHLVILVDDLESVDVAFHGGLLSHDKELCELLNHPEGLHVDFMRRDRDGVAIRTYEVGVEAETLACGTGVAGSAFVAHKVWNRPFPVRVLTRGGEMTVESGEHGLLISGVTDYLFSGADKLSGAGA